MAAVFYVEAGYDLIRLAAPESQQELVLFGGYENVNPRSQMSPYNYNPPAITGPGQLPPEAPSPSKAYVRGGINYRPLPSVALKLDLQVALDGEGPAQTAPGGECGEAGEEQGQRRLGDLVHSSSVAIACGLSIVIIAVSSPRRAEPHACFVHACDPTHPFADLRL